MAIDPRMISRPTAQFGTAQPAPALDPAGLVPVNRTQPVATDGAEAQRLMERRLGSMPPSSFSGAGAGFVPTDRPGVGSYADRLTDFANSEQFAKVQALQQPLSMEARRDMMVANGVGIPGANATMNANGNSGGGPRTQAVRDVVSAGRADANSRIADRRAMRAERVEDRQARKAAHSIRRTALQEKLAAMMATHRNNGMGVGTPAGGLLGLKQGI